MYERDLLERVAAEDTPFSLLLPRVLSAIRPTPFAKGIFYTSKALIEALKGEGADPEKIQALCDELDRRVRAILAPENLGDMPNVELVNLPTGQKRFKVIQLYLNGKPVLVCEWEKETPLHVDILRKFLTERGIDFPTVPVPRFPGQTMPALIGSGYRVVGMGEADISPNTRLFECPYRSSVDYKMGASQAFNELLKKHPYFQGWSF